MTGIAPAITPEELYVAMQKPITFDVTDANVDTANTAGGDITLTLFGSGLPDNTVAVTAANYGTTGAQLASALETALQVENAGYSVVFLNDEIRIKVPSGVDISNIGPPQLAEASNTGVFASDITEEKIDGDNINLAGSQTFTASAQQISGLTVDGDALIKERQGPH